MRNLFNHVLAGAGLLIFAATTVLANNAHLPPLDLYKSFVSAPSETGWVVIGERPDRQTLYFVPLVGLTCGISEVRYSVNSDTLDQRVNMPPCDGTFLLHVPRYRPKLLASVDLAPGTAKTVTMQVVFTDGSKSEIRHFTPCPDVGRGICSRTIDQ